MQTEVIITIAGVTDAAALTALGITTFRDAFGPHNRKEDMDKYVAEEMNQDKITAELNDTANVFFLARNGSALTGYVKLRRNKEPEELGNNNPIEIERIYVLQDYQGMKIGATLMRYCIDYAINEGHDIIWLGVWEHNHGAIRFYEQWGFELFGAHPFLLGDDLQTDVLMKRRV